jgi:hypothetical protein
LLVRVVVIVFALTLVKEAESNPSYAWVPKDYTPDNNGYNCDRKADETKRDGIGSRG